MKNVKRRIFASFIQVARIAAAFLSVVTGTALPSHAQPQLPARGGNITIPNRAGTGICNLIYNGQKITPTAVIQAFHVIQAQKLGENFSAGDRILLRLAKGPKDPGLRLLSLEGMQEFGRIASEQPDLKEVLSELVQRPMTEAEINAALAKASEHPLEAMLKLSQTEDWDGMIRVYESLGETAEEYPYAKLQAALAYNRRNQGQDRVKAREILSSILQNPRGLSAPLVSEASGILARMYKDLYLQSGKFAKLLKAIESYLHGFTISPGNYYPGIAALELIETIPGRVAREDAAMLKPMVKDAVRESLAVQPNDVWALWTQFKLAITDREWPQAFESLRLALEQGNPMSVRTSLLALPAMRARWASEPATYSARDLANLDDIIQRMESYLVNKTEEAKDRPSLKLAGKLPFPDTEGAVKVKAVVLREAMERAEVTADITPQVEKGIQQISVHNLLYTDRAETNKESGYLLGVTGPHKKAIATLARRTGHTPWWDAYDDLGIPRKVEYTELFIDTITKTGKPVILTIPNQFRTLHQGTTTWEEYQRLIAIGTRGQAGLQQALLRNAQQNLALGKAPNIRFVYGAYDLLGIGFIKQISEKRANRYDERFMNFALKSFQDYLVDLGPQAIGW